ncbi:MAG TPA: hypothetical protein VJI52_04165 [Candidatus Nanoarchaeia archaeon]|nr:hypothetical protein [Candidatus Nanoarchaeia archaeon]
MFWKKKDESGNKLIVMNDLLKKSFTNVKKDTSNIFQWLNFLYKKNMQQDQMIRQLQMEMSYMPKTREDIRRIIDDYYSFEGIMSKMRDINFRVDELARMQAQSRQQPQAVEVQKEAPREVSVDFSHIEKRLEKLEQRKDSMKEKIIKKITRNSKEYVKSVMISYIRKYEKISALQLKEMVVDEQNFCSKSSFYRLLEEIEQMGEVGVMKAGKEKHYFLKMSNLYTKPKSI